MNNFEKVSKDKLPDRCEFYSPLKDKHRNKINCLHSIDVWIKFKKDAMGDYHYF